MSLELVGKQLPLDFRAHTTDLEAKMARYQSATEDSDPRLNPVIRIQITPAFLLQNITLYKWDQEIETTPWGHYDISSGEFIQTPQTRNGITAIVTTQQEFERSEQLIKILSSLNTGSLYIEEHLDKNVRDFDIEWRHDVLYHAGATGYIQIAKAPDKNPRMLIWHGRNTVTKEEINLDRFKSRHGNYQPPKPLLNPANFNFNSQPNLFSANSDNVCRYPSNITREQYREERDQRVLKQQIHDFKSKYPLFATAWETNWE